MNENRQQVSFHLVLPSTSSHEMFSENHAGKFITMLPKEIQLDQKFHWEMALVELFGQNKTLLLSLKICGMKHKVQIEGGRELTFHPLHFLSVTSLFDHLRKIFKDKIDITHDEYKQSVVWKMKDMSSNLFKVRLSNLLAKSMGFNMSLEFSPGDDPDDDYAKITKV